MLKRFFVFVALAMVGSIASAAGFDEYYEVRIGDSDNDGLSDDLYVRQKPRIVFVDVGDLATPIVIPSDVKEVVLEYNGSAFTMRTNLSSVQKSQYAHWAIANVETTLGDLNADGRTDLIIKGISIVPNLGTALDQILFADATPTRHRRSTSKVSTQACGGSSAILQATASTSTTITRPR